MEVEFDLSALRAEFDRLADAASDALPEAVLEAAREGVAEALATKRYTDRSGGGLTASTTAKPGVHGVDYAEALMHADKPYASLVNDGTDPHDIYPDGKKALHWEGAGHPVAHVRHPGTEADGFMDRGRARAEQALRERAAAVVARALQSAGRR